MKTEARYAPCRMTVSRCHPLTISISTSQPRRRAQTYLRFRKRIAPSKHSGLNSLSPKDPNSSLSNISTGSGISIRLMSPGMSTTEEPHSFALRPWRLVHQMNKRGSETHAGEDARHKGIRVLLDCVDKCIFLGSLNSFEASRNEGTTPSTCDTNDTTRY